MSDFVAAPLTKMYVLQIGMQNLHTICLHCYTIYLAKTATRIEIRCVKLFKETNHS